ncbi:hypothetical protein ACIQM4_24955 [Streptomyces sp. NPDC091272]|uniref:hypothetical protein n=1 Tax=Streptomyces sp. NPDC091272 TaxID=3365981 RepID=UPI0037F31F9C
MAEENPQTSAEKAQLAQDRAEVREQLGSTENLEAVAKMRTMFAPPETWDDPPPVPLVQTLSRPGHGARTSFEAHDLNAMIDLVENANPAELAAAGEALWAARTALKDAAKELSDYVGSVDWHGEGGTRFRTFGKGLAAHAGLLGDFAHTAGTQIMVASTGLTSVHKAMPPRDSRLDQRKPDDVPLVSRVEGNPAYDAALKVEKDRQEAINQMNRLSSFYMVSEQNLAMEDPPQFDQVLKANVPPPSGGGDGSLGEARGGPGTLGNSGPVAPADTTRPGEVAHPEAGRADAVGNARVPGDTDRPVGSVGAVSPAPVNDPSMQLAQTAAPPAPAPVATPTTVPTSAQAPTVGNTPPMAPGYAPPAQGGVKRAPGISGMPAGRPGAPGQAPLGRAGGPGQSAMGRPGAPGQAPMGRGSAQGQAPMGRAGAPGQPPMGRAGRTDGITGGNPQRTAPGSTGSRIPRGTVVGGESGMAGRTSAGRVPAGGAIGANPAGSRANRPTGRPASSTNGVVGTPRNGAAAPARPGTGGFTQGGAGLVRGPAGPRDPNERDDEHGSERPDYLTEDEETWTAGRRSAVPPVIG